MYPLLLLGPVSSIPFLPPYPFQEQQLRDKLDEENRKATSSRIRQTEQQKEANRSDAAAAAASQVGAPSS